MPALLAGAQGPAAPPARSSESFPALSAQAAAARDANRLSDALLLYKKALALKPNWAEGWWSVGTIAYDQSLYAEAASAFQKTVALAPRNGTAHVMLGLSEFELGHDVLSLKEIEKGESLGLDADEELRHVALYHQGVLLQRKEKFQAAREILEQLCVQGVHSDEITTALGMTLLRHASKNVAQAGSADADVATRVGRAECLAAEKKFDEARNSFAAAVTQYPKYPEIHYAYGLFLVEASDLPAAIDQFKAEIQDNPADVISRLQIAAATYKTDSAAGIPFAEDAVKLAPQQPFGHFLLGLLRLDLDDYMGAIPELELAEKGLPREAKLYAALASAYSRAGRKPEAARARATFARLNQQTEKAESRQLNGESGAPRNPLSDSVPIPQ